MLGGRPSAHPKMNLLSHRSESDRCESKFIFIFVLGGGCEGGVSTSELSISLSALLDGRTSDQCI